MRITKQALVRRWALCTIAAILVFAVLAWLDAKGMEGSYAAIFTQPTRSPRQW